VLSCVARRPLCGFPGTPLISQSHFELSLITLSGFSCGDLIALHLSSLCGCSPGGFISTQVHFSQVEEQPPGHGRDDHK
jgi:hypothetical protein